MPKSEPITYELFAERGNTDKFLKRLKNEVDYYNNTKQPVVPMSCWVGWYNFEIVYTSNFAGPAYEFFQVDPTKMKGWITEENGGLRIRYSFEKVERFKKWNNFMGIYAGIFFTIIWIWILGDWSAQIGKAEWSQLLIALLGLLLAFGPFTALFTFAIWRRGSIPKWHRTQMEEILRAAVWEG